MLKANLLIKILGVLAISFTAVMGIKAQTLIANYPFNNTLAPSVGSFGSAVIGTAGAATTGTTSVCTDNINNDGLRTPSITSLSTSNFQIDLTLTLNNLPTNANAPIFVINGGTRYFGLLLNQAGQLKILYNNAYQSNVASGISLTTNTNYNIQLQYVNGVTALKVNNQVYQVVSLPALSQGTGDRTIYLGDNPGAPQTDAAINGCYSDLKVYNNPVAFYPSLTIIGSGETGTSGTNWSLVGNELIVSGAAAIQASVIESALSTGDLLIKGSPESIGNITIGQVISYTGSTIRNLTFGTTSNTGDIDVNANLDVNANITLNSSTTSMLSTASIQTYAGTVLNYNITLSSNYQIIDGSITGTGSILKTGANQLVFTNNNNTFSGGITISGGFVQIGLAGGSTGSLGTGNIILTNSSNTLVFNKSGNYTIDNLISGAGKIQKWGTGILTLTANNTFSGGTNGVYGGTIQVGNGGTSGAIGSGNFNIDVYNLIFNRSDDFIVNCSLQGSGNITKNGAGKLTLASVSNSHTGLITVNGGTLEFGNGGTGVNFWTSYSVGVTKINLNTGTTLIMNFSNNVNLAHAIIGSGSFVKNGTNIAYLLQDVNIPTITINGGTLIANSSIKLTVSGLLTNNGVLTLNNNATLVQGPSSTTAGTGVYNVLRAITGAGTTTPTGRFWYIGSPVSAASSSIFFASNAANVAKKRDEAGNSWVALTSGSPENLELGRGYYIQAIPTSPTLTFTGGSINNGAITINGLSRTAGQNFEGFNLVSNPYPSYLDWDAVTKTNIGTTMWYRSATSNSSGSMVFDTYVAGAGGIGTNLNGTGVSNLIPPMQAFWVRVNSGSTSGSLAMDNSMRAHFTSINGSSAGLKSTNNNRKLFLRMNLLQGESKDQIIVYVDENATNGFDQLDGEKMMQATLPQFYTKAGDKKIVINGLNSAKKQQALPISMELPSTGVHTFEIENLEIESGLVWLEDTQAETMEALTEGYTYQFYGEAGINSERFVLHFNLLDNTTPSAPNYGEVSSNSNFNGKGASVHAEAAGVVVIKLPASTEGNTDIQIRDAAGKLVYTGSTNTLETSLQLEQANGIYYVTLNSASGVEVRKVFVQK